MHITLRIIKVKYPKTLEAWKDYVIADVEVVACREHPEWVGQKRVYKGVLPSRAPYFNYTCKHGVYEKYDQRSFEHVLMARKDVQWSYTKHLTVEGLMYMLMHEFRLAKQRTMATTATATTTSVTGDALHDTDDIGHEYTYARALNEIRRMVQHEGLMYTTDGVIDEDVFRTTSMFKRLEMRGCDYFRLEYLDPLRVAYDKKGKDKINSNERNQMTRLQSMPPKELVTLYNMARSAPWLLCLDRYAKKFKLKPITHVRMLRLAARHHVTIPKRIAVSMSVLQHVRQKLYHEAGNTVFYMAWLRKHYRDASPDHHNHMPEFTSAVKWLVTNGGLCWIQPPLTRTQVLSGNFPECEHQGTLCFPRTMHHVDTIMTVFHQVAERCETHVTRPRDPERGVVSIPPKLTDEQTAAMAHVLGNWLTLVVGPPGRGKTAVIESAFAHVYGICNITYVGTMVSAQRERLGGRNECSRTAHSLYHSMQATAMPLRKDYVEQVEMLIWDEFSNAGEGLVSHVLRCFQDVAADDGSTPSFQVDAQGKRTLVMRECDIYPRLAHILLVMDPHQINPINPSCCAKDLLDALPMHIKELTVNLRVDPVYRALADLAMHVLYQRLDQAEFADTLDWSRNDNASNTDDHPPPVVLLDPRPSTTPINAPLGRVTNRPRQRQQQQQDDVCSFTDTERLENSQGYAWVSRILTYMRHVKGICDPMDFKFITPTRRVRNSINQAVERLLIQHGWLDVPEYECVTIRRNVDLYPGQIIAISGASFKVPQRPTRKKVDEIRNGEILRVKRIETYDNTQGDFTGAYYVVCETRSGVEKCMILDANIHVDPSYIILGYCVTIDASQGSEWDMVCAWYHDGAPDHTWITMERLYVSVSRAKKGLVIMAPGGRAGLSQIASRRMPRRYSALSYALKHDPNIAALERVRHSPRMPVIVDPAQADPPIRLMDTLADESGADWPYHGMPAIPVLGDTGRGTTITVAAKRRRRRL